MAGHRFPDLFIAGVPKAATTTWYHVLDRHPDVFMADRKELRFLDQDLTFDNRVETEEAYLSYYEQADAERRLGEASPWYFYSEVAPQEIRRRSEDPRILVFLRDPVERLYSLHGQMVNSGAEDIEDFREALEAQPDREQGHRLPDLFEPLEGLRYWDIAHYAPHVRRYQELFDDDELLFVRFGSFTEDPKATYRKVCRFLEIDDAVEPEIPSSNAHHVLRSHRFRDLLKDPPGPVRQLAEKLPPDWSEEARQILWHLNLKEERRAPMPEDLRRDLTEHCRPDVEELEELLGWDLTGWKAPDRPTETP